MFKTHPNFNNIEWVVMPLASEFLSDAGDISLGLVDTLDKFEWMFPTGFDRRFTEGRDNKMWQLETLSNREEI